MEETTRNRIAMLLKKADFMTVADLSRQMKITPMAVRQHLVALERSGMVEYTAKRSGKGRPVFLYRLTRVADNIFPKAYGKFISDVLRSIEKVDGREKLNELFRLRKNRLLKEKKEAFSSCRGFPDRVSVLAEMLDEEGHMVELEYKGGNFTLKLFNCPISEVTSEFPEACKYELALFRRLLGGQILRIKWRKDGSQLCTYLIQKSGKTKPLINKKPVKKFKA